MDAISRYIDSINEGKYKKFLIYSTEKHNFLSRNGAYVGGFADRIKGIITAYLISIKLNRVFVIDWTKPWRLDPTLKPAHYNWSVERWYPEIFKHKRAVHIDAIDDISMIIDVDIEELEQELFQSSDIVFLNINSFSWDYTSKLCCGFDAPTAFHLLYKSLFAFTMPASLQDLALNFEKEKAAKKNIIGLHFRTGDGNGWSDPSLSHWSEFEQFILSAIEYAGGRGFVDPAIYFASDSQKAKDAAEEIFRERGLFVSRNEIGHIERSELENREAFDYAISEFHVLAACDYVIGRAGGYYGTAALAGGKQFHKL